MILDKELQKQLQLTTEDLRFADNITKRVEETVAGGTFLEGTGLLLTYKYIYHCNNNEHLGFSSSIVGMEYYLVEIQEALCIVKIVTQLVSLKKHFNHHVVL